MEGRAGGGAQPERDGVDAMEMINSMSADSLDIEHDEIQRPFLVGFHRLAKDQAGLGKRRGGASASIAIYMHNTPGIYTQVSATPNRFPCSVGVFGGYAANCGPAPGTAGAWQALTVRRFNVAATKPSVTVERSEPMGSHAPG